MAASRAESSPNQPRQQPPRSCGGQEGGPSVCARAARAEKAGNGTPWVPWGTWGGLTGKGRPAGASGRPSRGRSGARARQGRAGPGPSSPRNRQDPQTQPKVHGTGGDGPPTSRGTDSSRPETPTRDLRGTGNRQTGARDPRAATRRKRGARLGPGVGGGRSRPSPPRGTPGASSHVRRRSPLSEEKKNCTVRPGARRGRETLHPSPTPSTRRRGVGGRVRAGRGLGPQPEPRLLSRRGPRGPAPPGVDSGSRRRRPPAPPTAATRPVPRLKRTPTPAPKPEPRGPRLPERPPHGPGCAAPTRAPSPLGPNPHARGPTPDGPGRQPTRLAALTSGSLSPRSHSHPEPRRPSEHLEEGGTPGTWQL
ncbi:proline-rich protein 2-like [Psammomys obesus]|uniref:proline-rich protein 2-like n=1 Tax=Psammomys obesus TaxID=48139 RepID=UPI0024528AA3|nr:proline-rich protein 2-like [Psammomys obesus]